MAERTPPFLDRDSYRFKRLLDAARILPVLAVVLTLFPLPLLTGLVGRGDGPASAQAQGGGLAVAVYLFAVWLAVVAATGLLSWRLRRGGAGRG